MEPQRRSAPPSSSVPSVADDSQRSPNSPLLGSTIARQGGVFTATQAIDCGYTRAEIAAAVKAGVWHRLQRGVFIPAAQFGEFDAVARHVAAVRGVLVSTARQTFASHLSAAVVHGLPVLGAIPAQVCVTHPGPAITRKQGPVKHYTGRVRDDERVLVERLPALTVARTVADIARTATFEQGVVVADAALRRGLSRTELDAMASSCCRWPGARQLSRVVAFARPEAESPGESLSRIGFAAQGLPVPRLQIEIYDCDGLIGRADFLWDEMMTIAEFDGRLKYIGPDSGVHVLYDEKRREDRLREAGFEVVRFSWADICNRPAWVAARIRAAFARHANRSTVR
ncbi:MAG: type IV toxin-antitoxin system AbiEi family antitoxin domain-containing protein [Acidothermaceae bacterium]